MRRLKTREARCRRILARDGYRLFKSRIRNPDHPAYGGYCVIDPQYNSVVVGSGPFGPDMSLEDVEEWLEQSE